MQRPLLVVAASIALVGSAAGDPLADRDAAGQLYRAESWAEAADAYARLAADNPAFGAYSYFLGVSLAHSGRCAEAVPTLERAITLGAVGGRPSLRRAYVERAACAAERGDTAAAVANLRTAYERFGFEDFAGLQRDHRFTSLAGDAAFQDLAGLATPAGDRIQGWRSDLDRYVALVEARHPNPFHTVDAATWRAAAASIRADIPVLTDTQVVGRFMQLAAMIGDGHTQFIPPLSGERAFHLLPIWPYFISDAWHIGAAAPEHRDLVGARIVSMNGVPMEEIDAQVRTMIPQDNAMSARWISAIALQFAEVAALAGSSTGASETVLEVETQDGARRAVTIASGPIDRNPTTRWSPPGWPSITDSAELPTWLAHANETFFLAPAGRDGIVYAQVNAIGDGEDESFADYSRRLGEALRERRARTLVLDLRHNNGGNGGLNWTLVREIVRGLRSEPATAFYVIVGRRTFSAGMTLAAMLDTHTNAIFVGEPTGSRPNFYGEDTPFTLPYSGLTGSISSAWFQGGETSDDLRPWIAPDLPAPLTIEDLRTGRDPAMAAIRTHLAERSEDEERN
jgi:hypothetical protein